MSLTLALTMSVALLAGGKPSAADALTTKDLGRVKVKVPTVWKATTDDGTKKWEAPSKDASFSLDAFPWDGDPKITPEACRDKLTSALGGEKPWEMVEIGGAAAAHYVATDQLENGGGESETHTYVGCNGKTKWVLTFAFAAKKKERFAPLADTIAKSLTYK